MANHGLYGVFWVESGRAMWGMDRSRRRALKAGRKYQAVVSRMDLPSTTYWDAPTFRVCSDVIADYRPKVAP